MKQEEAQEIIRRTFGHKAIAIGHARSDENKFVIFWTFRGESENNYREYEVEVKTAIL